MTSYSPPAQCATHQELNGTTRYVRERPYWSPADIVSFRQRNHFIDVIKLNEPCSKVSRGEPASRSAHHDRLGRVRHPQGR